MSEDPERQRDHELGMDRKITRRDFLDGVAVTVGGLALAGSAAGTLAACGTKAKQPLQTPALVGYPPDLTDLQGQTDAARAVPHMLRDGTFWGNAGSPQATGESYDLVVVGGGISGLAAAYFYTRQNPGARVLVLDNKDDLGGHAVRNEFTPVVRRYGRLIIGYGGTQSIDHPRRRSAGAKALLAGDRDRACSPSTSTSTRPSTSGSDWSTRRRSSTRRPGGATTSPSRPRHAPGRVPQGRADVGAGQEGTS